MKYTNKEKYDYYADRRSNENLTKRQRTYAANKCVKLAKQISLGPSFQDKIKSNPNKWGN